MKTSYLARTRLPLGGDTCDHTCGLDQKKIFNERSGPNSPLKLVLQVNSCSRMCHCWDNGASCGDSSFHCNCSSKEPLLAFQGLVQTFA